MEIRGMESISPDQLHFELQNGARFVVFEYTISILVMTFKNASAIYFVRGGEGAVAKGLGCSLCSFLLGWWGIPWGPIYTIGSLWTNFRGGKDVTAEVIAALAEGDAQSAADGMPPVPPPIG